MYIPPIGNIMSGRNCFTKCKDIEIQIKIQNTNTDTNTNKKMYIPPIGNIMSGRNCLIKRRFLNRQKGTNYFVEDKRVPKIWLKTIKVPVN